MSSEAELEPVYFVQISDTHIGPSRDYSRHGHYSLPCAEKVVKLINEMPVQPDFVIHTGDVVTDPHPRSYVLAAKTFSWLNMPIYYVNGNHDLARDIHTYLPMGDKIDHFVGEEDILSYSFEVKGYKFIVLDGRGPDEIDPHGLISPEQLNIVAEELKKPGPPLVIFIHYPCFPINSTWIDAYMLVVNGNELHDLLMPHRSRVCGVFYGHIHQPIQVIKDGIYYTSAASTFSQFSGWPGALKVGMDTESPPGFNFVHLMPDRLVVRQHTFPRPNIDDLL